MGIPVTAVAIAAGTDRCPKDPSCYALLVVKVGCHPAIHAEFPRYTTISNHNHLDLIHLAYELNLAASPRAL